MSSKHGVPDRGDAERHNFSVVGSGPARDPHIFRSLGSGDMSAINPVIDDGCPSSVAGICSAAALADRLNIPFNLKQIPKPFFHYFGPPENSSRGSWTVATWLLPIAFNDGFRTEVPIACVPGNDPVLLGTDFLDNCELKNPANLLIFVDPSGKRHEIAT